MTPFFLTFGNWSLNQLFQPILLALVASQTVVGPRLSVGHPLRQNLTKMWMKHWQDPSCMSPIMNSSLRSTMPTTSGLFTYCYLMSRTWGAPRIVCFRPETSSNNRADCVSAFCVENTSQRKKYPEKLFKPSISYVFLGAVSPTVLLLHDYRCPSFYGGITLREKFYVFLINMYVHICSM